MMITPAQRYARVIINYPSNGKLLFQSDFLTRNTPILYQWGGRNFGKRSSPDILTVLHTVAHPAWCYCGTLDPVRGQGIMSRPSSVTIPSLWLSGAGRTQKPFPCRADCGRCVISVSKRFPVWEQSGRFVTVTWDYRLFPWLPSFIEACPLERVITDWQSVLPWARRRPAGGQPSSEDFNTARAQNSLTKCQTDWKQQSEMWAEI